MSIDGPVTVNEIKDLLAQAADIGLDVYEDMETGTMCIDTGMLPSQIN